MQESPELIALLTEIRDLMLEQSAQQKELAARAIAQNERGLAMARRIQRVVVPVLVFVTLLVIGLAAWLWRLIG